MEQEPEKQEPGGLLQDQNIYQNYSEPPPGAPPGSPPLVENKPGKFPWWLLVLLAALLVGGFVFWGLIKKSRPKIPNTNLSAPTVAVPTPNSFGKETSKPQTGVKLCGDWPKFGEPVKSLDSIPEGFPADFPLLKNTKVAAEINTDPGIIKIQRFSPAYHLYLCSDLSVSDVFSFYKNSKTNWRVQAQLAPPGIFKNPYSSDTQSIDASKPSAPGLRLSDEDMIILFYSVGQSKTLIDLFYSPGQSLGE